MAEYKWGYYYFKTDLEILMPPRLYASQFAYSFLPCFLLVEFVALPRFPMAEGVALGVIGR
jgi:hypothetical protein